MPLNEELINANPWTGTSFHSPQSTGDIYLPLINDQFDEDRWYYAKDDDINVLKQCIGNTQQGDTPNMKKFFFNLDPQPWIGRWNVNNEDELPNLVILSQNPGIGDHNFLDLKCECPKKAQENGKKYYELMMRLFEGKALSSEILLDPLFQHYNGTYWLKKLAPLFKKIDIEIIDTDLLFLRKYPNSLKEILDRIMFVDLCPYHSLNANALGTLMKGNVPKFKSMNFTKRLVEMFMDKGKKIIITRASTKWKEFIPRLKDYGNIYTLNSKQNASVSEHNCNNFEEIVDSLKKSLI